MATTEPFEATNKTISAFARRGGHDASKLCANALRSEFTVRHILSGGRWGINGVYKLGSRFLTMQHPIAQLHKLGKPHPLHARVGVVPSQLSVGVQWGDPWLYDGGRKEHPPADTESTWQVTAYRKDDKKRVKRKRLGGLPYTRLDQTIDLAQGGSIVAAIKAQAAIERPWDPRLHDLLTDPVTVVKVVTTMERIVDRRVCTLHPGDRVLMHWWDAGGDLSSQLVVVQIDAMYDVVGSPDPITGKIRSLVSFVARFWEAAVPATDAVLGCRLVLAPVDVAPTTQPMRMVRGVVMLTHVCKIGGCIVLRRCGVHVLGEGRDRIAEDSPQSVGCADCACARASVFHKHPPRFQYNHVTKKRDVENTNNWVKDHFRVFTRREGISPNIKRVK
jgi:hypothetical protein